MILVDFFIFVVMLYCGVEPRQLRLVVNCWLAAGSLGQVRHRVPIAPPRVWGVTA